MNIFFVIKKKVDQGGGLELVTAPLTRGDILSGMMLRCCVVCYVTLWCGVVWCGVLCHVKICYVIFPRSFHLLFFALSSPLPSSPHHLSPLL